MQDHGSQDSRAQSTLAAIETFHDAFNRRDADAVMVATTEDCIAELPYPLPDGLRYEGAAAVRTAWETFFASSPAATFEIEEMVALGDRAVVRWLYRWTDASGKAGHVRGVDVMRVRDGKVAESLGYVKG
jgi:ketosteroid isomerase-like protein